MSARRSLVLAALVLLAGVSPRIAEPVPEDSYVVNGTFDAGMSGWAAVVGPPANSVTVVRRAGRPMAQLHVRSIVQGGRIPSSHTNLVQRNQRLTELEPSTDYVLSFRAGASSPRLLTVALAQEYRPYRNLGLTSAIPLDGTMRMLRVFFRTDSILPAPHEPDSSGPWLGFFADTLVGDTWIDDIAIVRTTRTTRVAAAKAVTPLPNGETWEGGGRWSSLASPGGAQGWTVKVPANGCRFVWRSVALGLDEGPWNLVLMLWTDAPQNVGRVSLMGRSGFAAGGKDDVIASACGFTKGWNRVVFPRERFFRHWFSHFTWRQARTIAMRIETNGNGPATVVLGDLSVESRDPGSGPPVEFHNVAVTDVGEHAATVIVDSDSASTAAIDYGPTTAYERTLSDDRAATVHRFQLTGLTAHVRYHVRARVRDASGASTATGDIPFATVVTALPGPPTATGRPYDLGIYGVNKPQDLARAAASSFDPYQNYQLNSGSNNGMDVARHFLDVARSAHVTALMGLDESRVKAGDLDYVRARVRAFKDDPAVRGWYEFDEPENKHLDPATLTRVYQTIHEEDPIHPVMIAASWLGADYPLRGAFDIALLDNFPVPFAGPGAIVGPLERARHSGEHYGFVFQAYAIDVDHRWPGSGAGPGRYPSRDEMRVMAYLAVSHGAESLWAFSYEYLHLTQGSEWKWVELTELIRELRGLEAMLGSQDSTAAGLASSANPALDVGVRRYHGEDYVIATNTAARPVAASVRLQGGAPSGFARVDADRFFEPAAKLVGSELRDTWRPYAVHVYRIAR